MLAIGAERRLYTGRDLITGARRRYATNRLDSYVCSTLVLACDRATEPVDLSTSSGPAFATTGKTIDPSALTPDPALGGIKGRVPGRRAVGFTAMSCGDINIQTGSDQSIEGFPCGTVYETSIDTREGIRGGNESSAHSVIVKRRVTQRLQRGPGACRRTELARTGDRDSQRQLVRQRVRRSQRPRQRDPASTGSSTLEGTGLRHNRPHRGSGYAGWQSPWCVQRPGGSGRGGGSSAPRARRAEASGTAPHRSARSDPAAGLRTATWGATSGRSCCRPPAPPLRSARRPSGRSEA